MRALHTDDVLTPTGAHHAISAPFGIFRAADGPVAIAIVSNPLFTRFANAFGRPDWLEDARFADDHTRAQNRAALLAEIEAAFAGRTQAEILTLLEEYGIPCGPLLDARDALAHEQAVAREMVVEEPDGFRTLGTPLKLEGLPGFRRRAPGLGEHNDLIDSWLAEEPRSGRSGDVAVPVQ
jgi:CoA:oxalate CoA-transferase